MDKTHIRKLKRIMPVNPASIDAADISDVDLASLRIPTHIGVTMDGNGRWAATRGRPRTQGHSEGIKALRKLVEFAIKFNVPYLTVYSFSSENWRRPKTEIDFIFNLLKKFVKSDLDTLIANNVRIRILGERVELETGLQKVIAQVEEESKKCTGLNLNVAFNYGGRSEITCAVKKIATDIEQGKLQPVEITEDLIAQNLFTSGIPDPDLLIRTGGEHRTSNFLLWQAAYAELVFLDVFWPDFNQEAFVQALQIYSARQRRFGGIETVK
jgi:undecaprenyl diphosphate synthase